MASGVRTRCRCRSTLSSRSPPRDPRAFATAEHGQQSGTTSDSPTMAKFDGTHKKRGSHDGLYAARMYRQDRRRLLRPLRQSSGCSPVRSSSSFGGVTRPRRRTWPNGSPSEAGSSPKTEQRPRGGLCAVRVYRQDRRRLLRRLRQSSGCSRVRSCRISGFGGITSPCRRRWANGSWPGVGKFPETEQRPYTGLHAARV
jgi:hypothetical protein